ncbi:MAG TPA: NlpC/P60 family protein [Desulfobacteria bacterium]|nr:NlpC/P60 family protein [Desulfobacteria bacterium]
MSKHWSKAVAASCLCLLLSTPLTAQAANLQAQLKQYQGQYNALNSQLKDQQGQVDSVTSQLSAVNDSVQALNGIINGYKSSIAGQQATLSQLNIKEQELSRQRQAKVDQLNQFIRANYEDGGTTYLGIVLGASNWSDLLDRLYQVQLIVKKYNSLVQEITDLNNSINDQQAAIKQKTASLQKVLAQKQQMQASYQQTVTRQQAMLSKLTTQQKATAAAASQAQQNVDYVQNMIQQQALVAQMAQQHPVADTSNSTPISTPANVSGNALVSYALQFLGTPYVWGGASPAGWDCSGFVQYIYSQFGVSLPRVSEAQINVGTPVTDLQPGDLVFFSSDGPGASHVGIYIGGGRMINAENPRKGTRIEFIHDGYWGSSYAPYLGARRIIQ